MKKIILIGDSIRMGYDKYVKMALEGEAEVYYPKENCRFTPYVLRNIHAWVGESGFGADTDLVHWNVGLWDVLELFGDGPMLPLEMYEQFVERICRRIRLMCPHAKVIFATSTPVWEEAHKEPERFIRSNSRIRQYNAAAVKIVEKYGFEINDLYGLLENCPVHYYSDKTHFYTQDATQVITTQVLKSIQGSIGVSYRQLDYAGLFGPSSDDVGM